MFPGAITGWNVLVVFEIVIALAVLTSKLRKRFPARVNCWFCNANSKVPYNLRNSWICLQCDQYNGFSPDGGYNKDIPAQYCARLNGKSRREFRNGNGTSVLSSQSVQYSHPAANGLCRNCNRNQELKVQKLASFVPTKSAKFDQEVEMYRKQLEETYALCNDCENVVRKQLNRVKGRFLSHLNHLPKIFSPSNSEQLLQSPMNLMHKMAIYCVIFLAVWNLLTIFQTSKICKVDISGNLPEFLADYASTVTDYYTVILGIFQAIVNYGLTSQPVEVVVKVCTAIIHSMTAILNPTLSLEVDQSLENVFTENFTIQLLGLLISLGVVLCTDGTYQNRAIGMFVAWSLTLSDSFMEQKTSSTQILFVLLSVATVALSCYNLSDVSSSSRDITDLSKTIYPDYTDSELDDDEEDLDVSSDSRLKRSFMSPGQNSRKLHESINESFRTTNLNISKNYSDNTDGRSSRNSLYATAIRSPHKFGDCTLRPANSLSNLSLHNDTFHSFDNRSVFSDLNSTFCDFKTVQLQKFPSEEVNAGMGKLRITDSGEGGQYMNRSPPVANVWQKVNSLQIQRPKVILANAKLSPNVGLTQSSWVAGGFWNESPQKKPLINSRFLSSDVDNFHPIESRSSSLSSGFESRSSSVHDNGQNNSRESSVSGDIEVRSAFSEPIPKAGNVNFNESPHVSVFTKSFLINRPLPVFPTITSNTQTFIHPSMFRKP